MAIERKSLFSIVLLTTTAISLASLLAVGCLWIRQEYKRFVADTDSFRQAYLESFRSTIKHQVHQAVAYMEYKRRWAERQMRKTIRERVDQAFQIAEHIYRANQFMVPDSAIKERIKTALRKIRFDGGRGYYFIIDSRGVMQLHSAQPDLEGRNLMSLQDLDGRFVVRDMVELALAGKQGFYSYKWPRPGTRPASADKTSFVRYFEPLGWIICCGEYWEDFTADVQKEVLAFIDDIRYGSGNQNRLQVYRILNLMGGDRFAELVAGPLLSKKDGYYLSEDRVDAGGFHYYRRLLKLIREQGEGFLEYKTPPAGDGQPRQLLSYFEWYRPWNLVVQAVMPLDDIDRVIASREAALKNQVQGTVVGIMLIFGVVLGVIFLATRHVCRRMQNSFDVFSAFFRDAARQLKPIDTGSLDFSEFIDLAGLANRMITERLEVEEAFRKSRARYQSLIENTVEGYWMIDSGMRVTDVNPSLCEMLGRRRTEIVGRSLEDFVLAEQKEDFKAQLEKIFHQRHNSFETIFVHPGGYHVFVHVNATGMADEHGRIQGGFGFLTDITDRRKADAERFLLATAIDHASESVVITDARGTIQYVNPAFEKVTGYKRSEAVGKTPRILKSGRHDELFYRQLWATISSGNVWHGHLVNRRKDGSIFEEEGSISPVLDDDGNIVSYVAVKRDVTEQVRLQRQFRQAQKMEAIGTLAGGIAHDFNNILSAIIGYAELAMLQNNDSETRKSVRAILDAGRRASDLVSQILAFSRQSEQEFKPVRVRLIAKEVVKLLRASLPATIEIRQRLVSDSMVLADPTQIHQMIMNLCTNANHAMEEKGGVLTIELDDVVLDDEQVASHTGMKPGKYLKLTVSDTGCGMTPEVMERIFDPFFTTKPPGKGTGMGLSVLHGIVKSYNGTVTVSSTPGKGTTFCVLIPVHHRQHSSRQTEESPLPGGSERILFVDDEDSIAAMTAEILSRLGYRVTSLTDSREALELFRKDPGAFDLVITDMTMPQLTGDRLARKLMAIRPDLPVILCTGFSARIDAARARALGIAAFVTKPVLNRKLAETIRKVLDKKYAAANSAAVGA